MIILTLASVAIVTTGVVSGTSVWACRRHPLPQKKQEPPLIFELAGATKDHPLQIVRNHKKICELRRSSTSRIVHNLYRQFGRVTLSHSDKEVALLYRNTVGNGGYIEFWSHDTLLPSVLYNLFSRWQSKITDTREVAPIRIYISSKLVHGTYELVLDDSTTKYLWSAESKELHKVVGTIKTLAAKVEDTGHGEVLLVYRDVINLYLAVCTVMFFTHR